MAIRVEQGQWQDLLAQQGLESHTVVLYGGDERTWSSGAFCVDPARPGFFCIGWDHGAACRVFRFTDPGMAVEFRLHAQTKAR